MKNGFWQQTFCHFKPREYLNNLENLNEWVSLIWEVPAAVIFMVFAFVMYLPVSAYMAFAPSRVYCRYKWCRKNLWNKPNKSPEQ